MRVAYAIVFISDMTRSVAFYRDVLGIPLRFGVPGLDRVRHRRGSSRRRK